MYISQSVNEWNLFKKLTIWTFCLNQSSITLRLENWFHNGCLVMIKCSSCFSGARGPNVLSKENRKLQQKLILCLLFFVGVLGIIFWFLFHVTSLLCGKDRFSQVGMGVCSSVYTSGLTYKLYWNVRYGLSSYQQVYQAFCQGTDNTTLLFIHN